jgi:hypothetical protein
MVPCKTLGAQLRLQTVRNLGGHLMARCQGEQPATSVACYSKVGPETGRGRNSSKSLPPGIRTHLCNLSRSDGFGKARKNYPIE